MINLVIPQQEYRFESYLLLHTLGVNMSHNEWIKKVQKENKYLVMNGLNHIVMISSSLEECKKELKRKSETLLNRKIYKQLEYEY